jgi:hypothetical protein
LRANPNDSRLEIAEYGGRSAIGGELLVEIADSPDVHLLGDELGQAPIEVPVDAILIVCFGILEIVGEAGDRGEFSPG